MVSPNEYGDLGTLGKCPVEKRGLFKLRTVATLLSNLMYSLPAVNVVKVFGRLRNSSLQVGISLNLGCLISLFMFKKIITLGK